MDEGDRGDCENEVDDGPIPFGGVHVDAVVLAGVDNTGDSEGEWNNSPPATTCGTVQAVGSPSLIG